MKYLTNYVPQGTGDTSAFEAAALAIIGDESTIPDIPVPETPSGSSMKFYQCTAVDTTAKTWSGKELVLTDGVYVVSETETAGLTYTTVTPELNVVYSSDCLIIAFPYTGVYGTVDNISYSSYSCPINPTSYTFGDYVISASSELTQNQADTRTAYNAFVENPDGEVGWHNALYTSPPHWLQWQNILNKELVNAYTMTNCSREDGVPVAWQLQGSDDGQNWKVLDNVSGWESGASATIHRLINNTTFYYYHRIYITEVTSGAYCTIGLLRAGTGTATA